MNKNTDKETREHEKIDKLIRFVRMSLKLVHHAIILELYKKGTYIKSSKLFQLLQIEKLSWQQSLWALFGMNSE